MFKTTPDLSKSFNPVPKTYKAKKQPKPLKPGKKVVAWNMARENLKDIFREWGITTCEIQFNFCKKNDFLTFAHVDKRRNLTDEEVKSPEKVVLACQPCHEHVEYKMDRKEARELLERIIARRNV